ncbi:MAG: restriction endonuclease subunit S [Candidatus Sericytochromatia bacterium]|nr:restriction endonuclease subunit S [Candidatus Sericytochromatia bacterium]
MSKKQISQPTSLIISEVADVYPGYQARGALKHDPQGTYSLLQGKDLSSSQKIFHDELLRLEPIGSANKYLVSFDDVLFQARGYSNQAFHIEEIPERVLAAATFYILKVRVSNLLPSYLAWFLNQRYAQNYFKTHANTSSAVSYVSKEVLINLEIFIPALETQAKIQSIQSAWAHEKNLMKVYLEKKEILIQESCLNALSHPIKEKRR